MLLKYIFIFLQDPPSDMVHDEWTGTEEEYWGDSRGIMLL